MHGSKHDDQDEDKVIALAFVNFLYTCQNFSNLIHQNFLPLKFCTNHTVEHLIGKSSVNHMFIMVLNGSVTLAGVNWSTGYAFLIVEELMALLPF